MIRVLHFGMSPNKGGIEVLLFEYYKHIDRTKVQFDFVKSFDAPIPFEDEIIKMGGKVYTFNPCSFKKNFMQNKRDWIQLYKEAKPDVVHYNTIALYTLSALKNAKRVGITHAHAHAHPNRFYSGMSSIGVLRCYINKYLVYLYSHENFACSKMAGKWAFARKFEVIPNAIDTKKFLYNQENRCELRKLHKIEDKFVLFHSGLLSVVKNQMFLLDVLNELIKIDKKYVLVLAGSGSLEKDLKEKVSQLNLEEHVVFLGNITNVNEYLSAADVFVFPSLSEGFGISLLEAQANGLKCIAASESNVEEVNITSGLKRIPLNDGARAWAQEIATYEIGKRVNNEEIQKLIEQYDISVCAKKLENIYLKECGY